MRLQRRAAFLVGSAFLFVACPKASVVERAPSASVARPTADPSVPLSAPAGVVQAGVYADESYPLEMPVPDGWRCSPGESDTPLRVSLRHDVTGARVEVRVEHAADRPRQTNPDCVWRYEDVGAHQGLRLSGDVTVATCAPQNPSAPRIFETRVTRSGLTYLFTVVVPAGQLMASRSAVEKVLSGVRVR